MSKPKVIQEIIDLGDGRSISIETGVLAKQADGAVMVRMGDTMMLATVVSAKEAREDVDFMPLSVDYKEKYAALGKFPGGFLKREARPSDYEILIARLVDRALRPLFPDDYHAETFVNVTLMSAEADTPPRHWRDWLLQLPWLYLTSLSTVQSPRRVLQELRVNWWSIPPSPSLRMQTSRLS